MKSIYKITFLFLCIPFLTNANIDKKKHEKSKKINKEFTVNSDAKVAINNRYGDLKITTWDKNKVEIEVIITVKSDDLDRVENMLENIDVEFESSSNYVSAKTILEKEQRGWSFWKRNKNVSYKINYTIKMPKSNSVDLDNDYGSIFLDNINGQASINCDYGKISVGQLNAKNNDINLDYCSSSNIGFMKSGNLNADYSKITIEEAEYIKSNTDYSTAKFEKIGSLDFNADYGSISVDEATNVTGNSDYASMRFGTIFKNLKIDTDYGGISVKRLVAGFESVDIDGQYAGIKIGVDEDAVFEFEMDLQYAGLRSSSDKMEFFKKISKTTKKHYEGKFGNGNSNSKLKIRSQYGGVSIKEIN
ncbi:hypothetical protein [Polaribacter porphyrae]|uniref:Adhesin domain-containing protein n=1 Tax=Polaribacter porphyrae TaxID=1137780 RepID=A0A2S7WL44_9FLAO|nr:hypothetical protein [Polaribacter porphyrae]PQJ78031.1 hypothetical protein BTO18_01975 [Polaribacter porphyrae]